MKYSQNIFFIFLLGFFSSLNAQKYSNEFLNIGVGAQAQAMGGAVVAHLDNVTAGVWNPAALTQLDTTTRLQFGAMHNEWFAGIGKYDYIGAVLPMQNNRNGQRRFVGASILRFGIDGIPNTLSLYNSDGTVNYNNITQFSAADYALLLHYAQQYRKISIGGNVKIIHRQIGSFAKAWGFGLDAALHYTLNRHFKIGIVAKDITTTFNAWSFNFSENDKKILQLTNNELPIKNTELTRPQITLGIAYQTRFGKTILTAELDAIATTDGKRNTLISAKPISINPVAGVQANYDNLIFLRAGVNNIQQTQDIKQQKYWIVQPSFGVGLRISRFQLDYAFTDVGSQGKGAYSHLISAMFSLKK